MSVARQRRYWVQWWRYEKRCQKVTGHTKNPLWWAMVEAHGRLTKFVTPRWMR